MAAGAMSRYWYRLRNNDMKVMIYWLSDGSGDVDQPLINDEGGQGIIGRLVMMTTAPGNSGDLLTNVPTDLYDITLLDSYQCDRAAGTLLDRSNAIGQSVVPSAPPYIFDGLQIVIANAGISKEGLIELIFQDVNRVV